MTGMKIVELALDSLDLRYEKLRARRPAQERRLLASLNESGQQSPIIVVPAPGEAGRYVVIDGHSQVRALENLKADVAKAVAWEMEPSEALMTAYQMKSGEGYNAVEEGWLVYEFVRVCGISLGEVGRRLDRTTGWASRRLGLVESLPEQVLDGVQKGKIGAYTAMKFLLPLARANASDCEKLAKKISENGFRSREVEALYRHYSGASRRVAQRILEDPARFLKALEEAEKGKQDLNLSEAENRCLKNLGLVGNISLALARSLPQVVGYDTDTAVRKRLRRAWQRCEECFGMLRKTTEAVFHKREALRSGAPESEGLHMPERSQEKREEVGCHA